MPIVSIITPIHNRPAYLKEAIQSVQAQTLKDWELIVVGDGATDETRELVKKFSASDRRIRYVHREHHGKREVGAVRNVGIRVSSGKYIAFLDDDDLFLPEKLACQIDYMEKHPEVGLVYSFIEIFSDQDPKRRTRRRPDVKMLETNYPALVEKILIQMATVLVRRRAFEVVGHFNEVLHYADDGEMWRRIARQFPVGAIQKPLAQYRKHGSDASENLWGASHETLWSRSQIPVEPEKGVTKDFKAHCLACLHYRLARICIEHYRRYAHAASHFLKAVCLSPSIGLAVHPKAGDWKGMVKRLLTPYLAIPYCVLVDPFFWSKRINEEHIQEDLAMIEGRKRS